MRRVFSYLLLILIVMGCKSEKENNKEQRVRFLMIDPQHFHASLVQKYTHEAIDSIVYLFAPSVDTANGYTSFISQYNQREENPTNWNVTSYFGEDFLSKAFVEDVGNVVVLAGDNQRKIDYIVEANKYAKDVFADKPLVIDSDGYSKLASLLSDQSKNGGMIYDMMTERYDVKYQIVKNLLNDLGFSGGLIKQKEPSIIFRSIHHFIKDVSGQPLIRPAMFFDTNKQGEGLVDVTTHYIDLVQWILVPEKEIDIEKDIKFLGAVKWKTKMTDFDFYKVTNLQSIPFSLRSQFDDTNKLGIYSNGILDYSLNGIPVSIGVKWNVEAKDGQGDRMIAEFKANHFSIKIKPDSLGKPAIFISPSSAANEFENVLKTKLSSIADLPGLSLEKMAKEYKIIIPSELYLNHEEHFAKVLNKFLEYRKNGEVPLWEKSYLLAKYYLTTQGLSKAKVADDAMF